MLTFPLHNAALDLVGKPPGELPHGLLVVPPEVRELLDAERAKHNPETFAAAERRLLNDWTVDWYFHGLGQDVIYRETSRGPDVIAVGHEETWAFKQRTPLDEQLRLEVYLGY